MQFKIKNRKNNPLSNLYICLQFISNAFSVTYDCIPLKKADR